MLLPFRSLVRVLYLLSVPCVTRGVQAQVIAATSAATASAARAASAMAGVVAPGDRIMLRVWREPSWSDSLLVSGDGDVVLPRIGRYHAAGLAPSALRDTVQRRLAVYLRDPSVDLVVLRRVVVLGAVKKADVYYVDPTATLRDVLARAGSFTDDADPNRIEIVRDGTRTRLGKWEAIAGDPLPVESGDQVLVGRRSWFARNAVSTISSVAVAASVLFTAIRR